MTVQQPTAERFPDPIIARQMQTAFLFSTLLYDLSRQIGASPDAICVKPEQRWVFDDVYALLDARSSADVAEAVRVYVEQSLGVIVQALANTPAPRPDLWVVPTDGASAE